MNEELARRIAESAIDKWDSSRTTSLDSEEIYKELIAKGIEVPENQMNEVLQSFKESAIIRGPGYLNSTAIKQHGAITITLINIPLLRERRITISGNSVQTSI